jgi:hypothetical protein
VLISLFDLEIEENTFPRNVRELLLGCTASNYDCMLEEVICKEGGRRKWRRKENRRITRI